MTLACGRSEFSVVLVAMETEPLLQPPSVASTGFIFGLTIFHFYFYCSSYNLFEYAKLAAVITLSISPSIILRRFVKLSLRVHLLLRTWPWQFKRGTKLAIFP